MKREELVSECRILHPGYTEHQITEWVNYVMVTHPNHRPKKEIPPTMPGLRESTKEFEKEPVSTPMPSQKFVWAWRIAILLLLLAIALRGHAQGTSQIDTIQFQDSSATPIKTYASPFRIRCGTGINCSSAASNTIILQGESIDARSYGASVTASESVNTAAIQAAIDAGAAAGKCTYIPGAFGIYHVTHLTLPSTSACIIGDMPTYPATATTLINGGTVIKTSSTDYDGLGINSVTSNMPTYRLENFTLLGPDAYSPRTTTSKHGVSITGLAYPRLIMNNIYIALYYGTGYSGLMLANVLNSTVNNSRFEYNDIGWSITNSSNGIRSYGIAARLNANKAIYIDGSSSGEIHATVESNEKSGYYWGGSSSLNWLIYTHNENNNTTKTSGESGIVIKPDSSSPSIVRGVYFVNPGFNVGSGLTSDCEAPILYGADANKQVFDIRFIGGYWGSVSNPGPAIKMHGNVSWVIIDATDALTPAQVESNTVGGQTPTAPLLSFAAKIYGLSQVNIGTNSDGSDTAASLNLLHHFQVLNPLATNDTNYLIMSSYIGNDATLGRLNLSIGAHPSATAANRFVYLLNGDAGTVRPFVFGWNALFAAASYLMQLNGNTYINGTLRATTFTAGSSNGLSQTIVVKGSDGNNCNVVYTGGIVTSTTCP